MTRQIDRIIRHDVDGIVDGIWKRQARVLREGDTVSRADLTDHIRATQLEIEKIRQVISGIQGHPTFGSLAAFVNNYIVTHTSLQRAFHLNVTVEIENPEASILGTHFREIDIAVLVDNILINAGRAEARNVTVHITPDGLDFVDDGNGLPDGTDTESLFDAGVSGRGSTGLGLSHVREIVQGLGWSVSIRNNPDGTPGACVSIITDT